MNQTDTATALTSSESDFMHDEAALANVAQVLLDHARANGATDAAANVAEGDGLSVSLRDAAVAQRRYGRSKSAQLSVFIDGRRGSASTADFSREALRAAAIAACDFARYAERDEHAGLPELEWLETTPRDLDLFHPWRIDAGAAIALAGRVEDAARAITPERIKTVSAHLSTRQNLAVLANTRGITLSHRYSLHALSCQVVAGEGRALQTDAWFDFGRIGSALSSPEAIGQRAGSRALARLGARKLGTRQCPVLFDATIVEGVLGPFVEAANGLSLYHGDTFLSGIAGERLFPEHVNLIEDPWLPRGARSAAFDSEGVRVRPRSVVRGGEVREFFLSSYTARKLGMPPTGHAGVGAYNLRWTSALTQPQDDFATMLRKLGTGLLVTGLVGQGVNPITGDYSRGAYGFWVEGGEIQFPVEEITVAGNLKQMYRGLVAIGADRFVRGGLDTGSVLIDRMQVAGL